MRDSFDVTTLMFAALAVFIVWKLWSVLGTRTGSERPRSNSFVKAEPKPDAPAGDSNVVRLPGAAPAAPALQNDNDAQRWLGIAEPGTPAFAALDAIAANDTSFVAASFLAGAKKAYEMIVLAFAGGDRKTLKGLLSKEVFESFSSAILAREARGEKVQTTFVSLDRATIVDAQFKPPMAQLTVRFATKLITVTNARDGAVVDGSSDKIVDLIDIWTFARDVSRRDPNWLLIATETGH